MDQCISNLASLGLRYRGGKTERVEQIVRKGCETLENEGWKHELDVRGGKNL